MHVVQRCVIFSSTEYTCQNRRQRKILSDATVKQPKNRPKSFYTSVVTFALGFVTLTPSCFARAMMSTRFREETLWAILWKRLLANFGLEEVWRIGVFSGIDVLGGVGSVVHQEELDVLDVVDEEGLVAGGHHEAGLLVGTIADLKSHTY